MESIATWRVAIFLVTVTVSQAVQWSPSPPDETIVQTCVGNDVTFPWNFTLEPGETLEDIKWHYADDKSSQLIAMSENTFFVTPPFSGRVHRLGNAGLVVSHVVETDGGNYSVQVSVHHGTSGTLTTSDRAVILQVATAPPKMEAGNLEVSETRTAVYNNLTHTWHVQLTCGTFTDLGQPPVDVVWKIPSGSSLHSTSYEDGHFHLLLSNPPLGGDYTCSVSSSCSHGDDPTLREATVTVDEVKARLTLLEAYQGSNELMKLRADLEQQKAELAQQKVENADLMQKNTELARQLDQYHGENVQLTNQLGNLTHYVHSLENQLCSSHSTANHGVSFHARLSSEQQANAPDSVILDHVITNEGGAYSPTTGVFTVPVNGTYVVFIAAGTTTRGTHAGLYLMVDNEWVCYTDSKDTDGSQSSSCQAVVHLVKGQRMWLKAGGTSSYWHYTTYFGGVLVRVG